MILGASLSRRVFSEEAGDGAAANLATSGIIDRSLEAGPVVFLVLVSLISLSVVGWALLMTKYASLRTAKVQSDSFIKSFWESRSLNELNSKLADFKTSPAREMFRSGYAELVRSSQLRDQNGRTTQVMQTAMSNMQRTLNKSKSTERQKLQTYLTFLATTASAAPFIGLFGTVWGIMDAFESIAVSGSSSLAAVAPGISEALIATAFGLAAAIPAAVGYNMANSKIKELLLDLEGFKSDFLNIVERYLVSEKKQASPPATAAVTDIDSPRI